MYVGADALCRYYYHVPAYYPPRLGAYKSREHANLDEHNCVPA